MKKWYVNAQVMSNEGLAKDTEYISWIFYSKDAAVRFKMLIRMDGRVKPGTASVDCFRYGKLANEYGDV